MEGVKTSVWTLFSWWMNNVRIDSGGPLRLDVIQAKFRCIGVRAPRSPAKPRRRPATGPLHDNTPEPPPRLTPSLQSFLSLGPPLALAAPVHSLIAIFSEPGTTP